LLLTAVLIQATFHVPRITFKFKPGRSDYTILRKQLPVVACYAVTFNSCQGLTVQRLALDLRRPVFAHGQLYTAMTRVPNSHDVVILKSEGDDSTLTRNIVWEELLL
jgi:ATP-dependent exoDNAse (exonuclease V) alpha subunit